MHAFQRESEWAPKAVGSIGRLSLLIVDILPPVEQNTCHLSVVLRTRRKAHPLSRYRCEICDDLRLISSIAEHAENCRYVSEIFVG